MANERVRVFFDQEARDYVKKINPWITQRRAAFLRKFVKGRVLEVGVGPALLAEQYADPNCFVGTDISSAMIEIAKNKMPQATFLVCDAESLPFAPNEFDVVVCSEVIYYLEQPELFIREAGRVLKDQGELLLLWGNPVLNSLYKLFALLGLRPEDPFGQKTRLKQDTVHLIKENLEAASIAVYGIGLPGPRFITRYLAPVLGARVVITKK